MHGPSQGEANRRKRGDRALVRTVAGANLLALADLLNERECCAYSLAFDGATVRGRSFLDVPVRLFVRGEIENVHLLAVPLRESYTGLRIANVVRAVIVELRGQD